VQEIKYEDITEYLIEFPFGSYQYDYQQQADFIQEQTDSIR